MHHLRPLSGMSCQQAISATESTGSETNRRAVCAVVMADAVTWRRLRAAAAPPIHQGTASGGAPVIALGGMTPPPACAGGAVGAGSRLPRPAAAGGPRGVARPGSRPPLTRRPLRAVGRWGAGAAVLRTAGDACRMRGEGLGSKWMLGGGMAHQERGARVDRGAFPVL